MGRLEGKAKNQRRPVAIDLFAGAGGLSLGAESAGFDVLAAVEYDPIHAAAHAYNFPRTEILCANAKSISGDDMRAAIRRGWNLHRRDGRWNGKVDAVFGGPPCQGFSVGGVGKATDDRNDMVFEFARIVGELKPRYFVMENVPGLQGYPDNQGKVENGDRLLDRLIWQLEFVGYEVASPVVLNAAFYGVPQDRRRIFLLGALPGEGLPTAPRARVRPVPKRTTDRPRKGYVGHTQQDESLPAGPTVAEAIEDLPNADDHDELWHSDHCGLDASGLEVSEREASAFARALRGLCVNVDDYSYPRQWDRAQVTSSMRTAHRLKPRQRMDRTAPGEFETKSRLYRLDGGGLCPTLRAGSGYDRGSYTAPRPIHPDLPRVITVREAARLHSFPDWFRFHPTKWHGFRQVGNALPPYLGQAVAAEIVRCLGVEPVHPTESIPLGDSELLAAGMLKAAEHFGAEREAIPGNQLRARVEDAPTQAAA
jgi:DNA (cytosine-5)-methyltransferase 1